MQSKRRTIKRRISFLFLSLICTILTFQSRVGKGGGGGARWVAYWSLLQPKQTIRWAYRCPKNRDVTEAPQIKPMLLIWSKEVFHFTLVISFKARDYLAVRWFHRNKSYRIIVYETFPECFLPSTVSKNTIKRIGNYAPLKDMRWATSYPIYA